MRSRRFVPRIGLVTLVVGWSLVAPAPLVAVRGLYPDLETVVPKHL